MAETTEKSNNLTESDINHIKEMLDFKEGETYPTDAAKEDAQLEKFISFKEKIVSNNGKAEYGVFDFEYIPVEMFNGIEATDKALAEKLDELEKKELALKTSLSPVNPLYLKAMHSNKDTFEATGEIILSPESEAHAFAVSIGLEDVQMQLEDTDQEFAGEFKSNLIEKFNIDLDGVPLEQHPAFIVDSIRDSIREDVNQLVRNHTGHVSSTSNWHVTGIITDNSETVTKDLQVVVYDTLNKIYPKDNIDAREAGSDLMVTYCPDTIQEAKFFKLNSTTVEASYSTVNGTINQANNALNMELMLEQATLAGVELSPFMLIDRAPQGQIPEGYHKATNAKKGTTFAFKPVPLHHNADEIKQLKEDVANNLPEKYSPRLTVEEMRDLQEVKIASYIPLKAIERDTLDKLNNKPSSESLKIDLGDVNVTQVKMSDEKPDYGIKRSDSTALMTDFSGYSKISQHLTELNVDAAALITPLMKKIAEKAEATNGLADDFAGDSVRLIYPSEDVIRDLQGQEYKASPFTGLSSAEKSLFMEIAIYKMKNDHEKAFEDMVRNSHDGNGGQFIDMLESKIPTDEDFKLASLAIQNETDEPIKNALAYIYARAKVKSLNGSLGIKSFSVSGNCNMSFNGLTAPGDRSQSGTKNMASNESLSARDFDLKRSEMEYASRQSNVVIDKKSFDRVRPEVQEMLSEITLPSGEVAYGLNMEKALGNEVIQKVFTNLGV